MTFSGGTLKIRIFPGTGNSFDQADYIQEFEVNFPPTALPVPLIIRSKFTPSDTATTDVSTPFESDKKQAGFYSGIGNGLDFNRRLQDEFGSPAQAGALSPIRRGDVMRSMYLDPTGPSRGDLRLSAGLRNVPSSFFTKFPGYDTTTKLQACGAPVRSIGNTYYRFSLPYFGTRTDTDPYGWIRPNNRSASDFLGKLVNLGYTAAYPTAPFGLTEATLSAGGSNYPGDWNTGVGSILDGPYITMGDQGYAAAVTSTYYNIYFPTNILDATGAAALTSFSPNRQIASPVLFGSLPTGIAPGGTMRPWQTLLFCPNPAAKNNHPGLASGGTGGPGPNARPPFGTAPDHLFLDNFWMPVVEPYAISEPFATAGKVNLNHRIAPFGHIQRSTGLYAVLKALKLPAIPNSRISDYKQGTSTLRNAPGTPSWRYNIDVEAVLAGMKAHRFDQNDVYHSASEISTVFLVPSKQPGATAGTPAGPSGANALERYNNTADWWNDKTLSGDNLRESPYDQIYSRITTKSNTFTVHLRVQALKQVPGWRTSDAQWATWNETKDQVVSEYRGSTTIERYVDPNDETIPDFASASNFGKNLAPYYRWRTISEQQFAP